MKIDLFSRTITDIRHLAGNAGSSRNDRVEQALREMNQSDDQVRKFVRCRGEQIIRRRCFERFGQADLADSRKFDNLEAWEKAAQ